MCLELTGGVSRTAIESWIQELIWEKHLPGVETAVEVLRIKGIFCDELGTSYIVQAVQELYEVEELQESSGYGKIVLIGSGLGSEEVRRSFTQYVSTLLK